MEFPRSCVLYLRNSRNTPDFLEVDVVFPDGAQAAANFALVNKKYRIIPEDIKLSKVLDVELLAEWDRYRKWILRTAGRMK